ncbi:MAG: glutamate racemase [Sporomusaceae bacterium]|jgi:glutamate racemase|nr:glutamate racemase [Sporomusaceae bacterium]
MDRNNLPIGIFDSGLGGLSVLKSIRSLLPQEDIIYFGDTKRAPYGFHSPLTIRNFTRDILHFVKEQNVKVSVAACNTITVNLGDLPQEFDFEIIEMQKGLTTAAQVTKNNKVGVIGTVATINSSKHATEAQELYPGLKIFPVPCPEFAGMVEAGELTGAKLEQHAREYLTPLKETGVDTVIMACTHYPFLEPVIGKVLENIRLVDPSEETALALREYLEKTGLLKNSGTGSAKFYFSANLDKAKFMLSQIGMAESEVACISL